MAVVRGRSCLASVSCLVERRLVGAGRRCGPGQYCSSSVSAGGGRGNLGSCASVLCLTHCWVLRDRVIGFLCGAHRLELPTSQSWLSSSGGVGLVVWVSGGRWWVSRPLFENYTVDASIFVARQATKGTWWMPWHQEPMKDVGACDKPREVGNRALIRGCPNGETQLESCPVTPT